jgi:leucyl/phenylalanyl-tRNA--protein transferase
MFPDLRADTPTASQDQPDDLVAMGADLEPGTLLAAYRCGLFPMPDPASREMLWWSPAERGVLPLDGLRVSRSLRTSARRFEIRVDTAFLDVVRACADPQRPGGWINEAVLAAYTRLFDLGWAHSVEAWRDGRLAGGLYGVAIGGLFAGESMFHHERDASKVALMGLVERLRDEHAAQRLLDVQWVTPHLESLGAVTLTRSDYLRRLASALVLPAPSWAVRGPQTAV